MKKIGPRVSETTEKFLKTNFKSLSGGAEYCLEAMPAVARKFMGLDFKGRLSREELYLIIDVMNGTMLSPQIAGQHIPLNVEDGIALDHLDQKWEVDGPALVEKLKAMSTPELFFLEIWVQGFWQRLGTEDEIKMEDYVGAAI